ncbi:MAG TPA: response regulator, partial [Lachnospiraceae bacterium]|nr:response regulator [Lachnospiraceae bacterium]
TEHGSVTLRMTWQPLDGEMIALLIEVEDTGAGIKEEDIPKIYEKFQRIDIEKNKNIEGTGLGMTITAQFVKMMDGEIRVRSQYGSGTCFNLKIPQKIRSQEVIGSIQKSRERELAELKRDRVTFTAPKARILVVDDNEINLKVFEGLLRKTQIHIETAESGAECLKLTEEQTYDLIFMDHMMPQMDGIEAFRRLKAQDTGKCRETPVIALTANAIVGAREEYIAEGFTDYLSKPIDGIRLREMLLRYLPKQLIIKI